MRFELMGDGLGSPTDTEDRPVIYVSVSANGDRHAENLEWWAHWGKTSAKGGGLLIIQHPHEKILHGKCPICGHYGERPSGTQPSK